MFITETDSRGFVQGREKAFEIIFHQYYKTLVSFAMRHDLEDAEAEDVVLETFHHIWQIRSELKSPAALHTLLFTAVRNRMLNVLRNVKNRQKIVERQFREQEESDKEFGDLLLEEEMSRLLDLAIADLPPQCRQVILSFLSGKSLQEIAVEMQLSVSSVKTYKLRAVEALREALKNYPFFLLLLIMELDR